MDTHFDERAAAFLLGEKFWKLKRGVKRGKRAFPLSRKGMCVTRLPRLYLATRDRNN